VSARATRQNAGRFGNRYSTARVQGGDFARAEPEFCEYLLIVFSQCWSTPRWYLGERSAEYRPMDIPSPTFNSSRPRSSVLLAQNVNSHARSQCWNTTPASYRNVESVRDGVGQSMARQCRGQTQRSPGSPISRFQQILVNFGSVGPTIEPPSYLVD
jgi:hypothetical protein